MPSPKYHLLQAPPRGGSPMMLRVPMAKAPKVIGMARPMPVSWLTKVRPVAT